MSDDNFESVEGIGGSVKILALSVFGILFVRVRRPSRLLKIVFPLLSPLSSFSSTEGESLH